MIASAKQRRAYRAPTGLPKGRDDWRLGSVVSALVHLGIIVVLFLPVAMTGVLEMPQGAGGPGPAGGGGGGNRGDGGLRAEMLRFVRVAPPEPVTQAPPRIETPLPPPKPVVPEPQPVVEAPREAATAVASGTTGGTGADNTGGSGPGSGGGVGSGTGTGRGSGLGPGTGGGTQQNYPPTPIEIFLPPHPVPSSVRGHHLIAEFDVDEAGKVLSVNFNETRDRGYNRRLLDVLRGYRFKPGITPDGKPLRMKAQVIVDLY